jgi:uncharacterized protein YecE (DUF72 family)
VGEIKVGISSWTEKTLVKETEFYPRGTRNPEGMLHHYASQFPLVEADAGFYRMPSEDTAIKWAERTPGGFTFNVKVFRAFTLHPFEVSALPKPVQASVPAEAREKKRLSWRDLPEALQQDLLEHFRQAQRPLHFGHKLGALLIQLPKWVFPSHETREHLLALKKAWPDYQLAVEFRNDSWISDKNLERTLRFLSDNDLTFVCVDEPQIDHTLPPLAEATSSRLAMVRFHGRNTDSWNKRVDSAAERFDYDYSETELREWLPKLIALSDRAQETHAIMNNCHRDYAVNSARLLGTLLSG